MQFIYLLLFSYQNTGISSCRCAMDVRCHHWMSSLLPVGRERERRSYVIAGIYCLDVADWHAWSLCSLLFFCDLVGFHYQPAKASSIIRSYTHVGVTCHVSESCDAETCLARKCATLLQFLLTKEKENSWKVRLRSLICLRTGSMIEREPPACPIAARPVNNQSPPLYTGIPTVNNCSLLFAWMPWIYRWSLDVSRAPRRAWRTAASGRALGDRRSRVRAREQSRAVEEAAAAASERDLWERDR